MMRARVNRIDRCAKLSKLLLKLGVKLVEFLCTQKAPRNDGLIRDNDKPKGERAQCLKCTDDIRTKLKLVDRADASPIGDKDSISIEKDCTMLNHSE